MSVTKERPKHPWAGFLSASLPRRGSRSGFGCNPNCAAMATAFKTREAMRNNQIAEALVGTWPTISAKKRKGGRFTVSAQCLTRTWQAMSLQKPLPVLSKLIPLIAKAKARLLHCFSTSAKTRRGGWLRARLRGPELRAVHGICGPRCALTRCWESERRRARFLRFRRAR